MFKPLLFLSLTALLGSCQPAATTTDSATPPPAGATEAEARAAVVRYLSTQPNAALYVPDSARVMDADTHWQVLVPRTDWARRMPNKAAFEVNKATGIVQTRPVK